MIAKSPRESKYGKLARAGLSVPDFSLADPNGVGRGRGLGPRHGTFHRGRSSPGNLYDVVTDHDRQCQRTVSARRGALGLWGNTEKIDIWRSEVAKGRHLRSELPGSMGRRRMSGLHYNRFRLRGGGAVSVEMFRSNSNKDMSGIDWIDLAIRMQRLATREEPLPQAAINWIQNRTATRQDFSRIQGRNRGVSPIFSDSHDPQLDRPARTF